MELNATITVPKLGEFLLGNASRAHNRVGKEAMRGTLEFRYKRLLPRHFERSAHGRYGYKQRQVRYRIRKQRKFGSSIDLVQTGRSRARILHQAQLTVSGTASGDTLSGAIKGRFDFAERVQQFQARRRRGLGGRPRKRPGVTIADMRGEVQRTVPDERRALAFDFRRRYVQLVKTTAGSRQQVKV